jgi:hypothetical protein
MRLALPQAGAQFGVQGSFFCCSILDKGKLLIAHRRSAKEAQTEKLAKDAAVSRQSVATSPAPAYLAKQLLA